MFSDHFSDIFSKYGTIKGPTDPSAPTLNVAHTGWTLSARAFRVVVVAAEGRVRCGSLVSLPRSVVGLGLLTAQQITKYNVTPEDAARPSWGYDHAR